ncbi:response regulator [Myxococcaceae bacterium GXIMD 01537]
MSTILLVDDEPEMLELFTEILELMDHRVLEAHDGQEALRLARERAPDLVVTDWMMPRMSGLELCHRLHRDAALHDVPVIMHSSSGDPHDPALRAFVAKDCPLEEFETVVTRALEDEADGGAPAYSERIASTGSNRAARAAG